MDAEPLRCTWREPPRHGRSLGSYDLFCHWLPSSEALSRCRHTWTGPYTTSRTTTPTTTTTHTTTRTDRCTTRHTARHTTRYTTTHTTRYTTRHTTRYTIRHPTSYTTVHTTRCTTQSMSTIRIQCKEKNIQKYLRIYHNGVIRYWKKNKVHDFQ